MRNIISICRKELLSFFVSPMAYFLLTGFMLLAGYFFFNLLGIFNMMVARAQMMMQYRGTANMPNLNQWVVEPFYQTLLIILVFLVPILTMRTIAEERRRGTFELLITSPLSVAQIVVGKFLATAIVLALMIVLVFGFPAMLILWGNPGPEVAPILSGLLATLLCGLAFASLAMGVSSFTQNQLVASVSSMVTLLLFYVIHSPTEGKEGLWVDVLKYISPVIQAQEMVRGVMNTSSLIYFASVIAIGLFISNRALEVHRWR